MDLIKLRFLLVVLMTVCVVWTCDNNDPEPQGAYSTGMFVLNEGAFEQSNASVSYFDAKGDSVQKNVFNNVNNRPLGDVLQSALRHESKMYLALNGSNKIEVVNAADFKEEGVVEGLSGPRYLTYANNKIFVTQWGDGGQVKVVDSETNEVVNSIDVGTGPEQILTVNDELWVANSGGYGNDSTISVIDIAEEKVVEEIQVAHAPKDFVVDKDGDIWVLCIGHIQYDDSWNVVSETPSMLFEIDATDYSVIKNVKLFDNKHPEHLEIDGEGTQLYVGGGFGFMGIYSMDASATTLGGDPLIETKTFYGFSVNPQNGEIYAFEAPNFTTAGFMYIYNDTGEKMTKYEVGIGPKAILF